MLQFATISNKYTWATILRGFHYGFIPEPMHSKRSQIAYKLNSKLSFV